MSITHPTNLPQDFNPSGLPLAELERLKLCLTDEVQDIQLQLADPDKKRYHGKGYADWRARAIFALTLKTRQLRHVKAEFKNLHRKSRMGQQETGPFYPGRSGDLLLSSAYRLLRQLVDDGVEFEPHELKLVDDMAGYLGGVPGIEVTEVVHASV